MIIYVVPQRYDPPIKVKAQETESRIVSLFCTPAAPFHLIFCACLFLCFSSFLSYAVNFPHPTVSHSLTQKGFFNLNLTNVCIASAHHPACALL